MRDIFNNEPKQMLDIARQGWEPLDNGWSSISVNVTGNSFDGPAKLLGKAYEKAMGSLVKQAGGDPKADLQIKRGQISGYPVTTFTMKTPVLESVRKLEVHPVMFMA
jgi:hypothetical protein